MTVNVLFCTMFTLLHARRCVILRPQNKKCQAFSPFVGIGSPRPLTQQRVLPPPFGFKLGTHSLAGEGAGGANSDEGTDTLVFLV